MLGLTSITTENNVMAPKIATLPDKKEFYLNTQIIVGSFPKNENEILVSSEFIYARFFGISLLKDINSSADLIPLLRNLVDWSSQIRTTGALGADTTLRPNSSMSV